MIRRVIALAATVLIVAGTTACEPAPIADPSAASSAEASDGSGAALCAGATVLGPDGSTVNLTGTWRGIGSGLLFVTQTGSCVAIEGLSNFPDEPLGTQWRSVFLGDLTSAFSVVGRWTWTRGGSIPSVTTGDTWTITMQIDFVEQNQPVIQISPMDVGFVDPLDPSTTRDVLSLERISSSTAYPD